eukprot:CAMPEP_0179289950 /NCGR_PEP_ID=MMETSP0797-20121207/41569_1 /TAXON_ID=47934 /ORGANISM="Dinophysis acuminata, Strain DAEP01" /LENGTH=90 /DNA_ID=CAMNT_0020998977 /DNA_START=60 /DNA_END=332 /DNA_ORIENTATION=-
MLCIIRFLATLAVLFVAHAVVVWPFTLKEPPKTSSSAAGAPGLNQTGVVNVKLDSELQVAAERSKPRDGIATIELDAEDGIANIELDADA